MATYELLIVRGGSFAQHNHFLNICGYTPDQWPGLPTMSRPGAPGLRTTTMRMPCFAVLCCLALAACDHEPAFDAQSLPAYQQSLAVINARLSEKDRRRLQVALMTLATGYNTNYTAFALANPDKMANFESLDGVANPMVFLDHMRAGIQGRTAASVIRHVTADLDFEISRAESQADGAEKALAAFVVENPRYSWDRKRNTGPTVACSIYNGSKTPISTIYLTGELTTAADSEAPLVMREVSYRFGSPLQPGAQQDIQVWLGWPGPWTAKQIEQAYDAALKLKVANVGDPTGKRLLAINVGWLDVMRKKRDLLRAG
jgi:hypothetical protein